MHALHNIKYNAYHEKIPVEYMIDLSSNESSKAEKFSINSM